MDKTAPALGRIAGVARAVLSAAAFSVAAFVFIQAMTPHVPDEPRNGVRAPVRSVSIVKTAMQTRIYYYVVASEQHAKQLLDERNAASDYFGSGQPATPPIIVVARTQEVFDGLQDLLYKTAGAGGPPYAVIDLR